MNIAELQKAELHCHADGVVDPEMLAELESAGHDLGVGPEALAATLPVDSFESWTQRYCAVLAPALNPVEERYALFLEIHIRRLKAQRVRHAEIFVNRFLGVRQDIGEMVDLFAQFRQKLLRAAEPDLRLGLVVCIARGSPEKIARQSQRILALWDAGLICGVALAGDEGPSLVPLRPFFQNFHHAGLGIEIHAGETRGPESVWEAIEHGFAHRIGHAVSAFRDGALMDAILKRDIHLEFCVSSNLRLGVIDQPSQHPLRQALRLGVPFSLNTDDPGPFQCTMTSECELVERSFGLTESDFAKIFSDTLRASFASRRSTKAKSVEL